MADILDIARQFRADLLARDRAAAGAMVAQYGLAWTRLQRKLEPLVMQIEAARARGEAITPAWLGRQERYLTLLREVGEELLRLSEFSTGLITAAQRAEIARGSADALAQLQAATAQTAPAGDGGRVAATFNALPRGASEQIAGFLADGSPLARLLGQLPKDGREDVARALAEGVTLGENPRKVASRVRDAFGGNLTRALTVTRTEMLRAYRESSRATWAENEDRVAGWQWLSARQPGRTCASCYAMDGQIFPVAEPMGTHPRCRCSTVVVLKSAPAFVADTGEEVFAKLPPARQLETLGPAKFKAYKEGSITLRDLVGHRESKAWGVTRSERGLAAALAGPPPGKTWGKLPKDHRPEVIDDGPEVAEEAQTQAPIEAARPQRTAAEARQEVLRIAEAEEGAALRAKQAYDDAARAEMRAGRAPDRTYEGIEYYEWRKRRLDLQGVASAARDDLNAKARAALYQDRPATFKVRNRKLEPTWVDGIEAFRRLVGAGVLDDRTIGFKKIRGRANYGLNNEVRVKGTDPASVIVHELGHWLEDNDGEIFAAVSAFLERRAGGERPVPLRTFMRGYGAGEITRPDKFMDPYIGKVYNRSGGKRYASEVVSMGLQYFYEKPIEFARQDPDFFDFIYDLVRKRRG